MSNTKNLANLAAALDDGTSGQVLQSTGSGGVQFADSTGSGVTVHANQAAMLTDAGSADEGTLHYETGTNKLYVKQSSGFFMLAEITNVAPTIGSFSEATGGASANDLTNATPPNTFTLTAGSNTVITINATDDDLETISYSATVTSGTATNVFSSPSFPVSNQSSNVFTLTPVTSGAGGTVTIRFDASDGTNVANVSHSFEIAFTITDSHYTSLLMATDGSAGDNNDITDSSSSNRTITVNGDAHAGTFSPYRHGGYSWDFDGGSTADDTTRGESIVAENTSSAFNVGTNDYSVELWIKARSYQTNEFGRIFDFNAVPSGGSSNKISLRQHGNTGNLQVGENGSYIFTSSNSTPLDGEWHFIQLIRTGGTTNLYIDGTSRGSASSTTNIPAVQRIVVGANTQHTYGFDGQIADFRFSNTARTAGTPTQRLTSDSNTKLLVCSKPYLVDESSTATSLSLSASTNRDKPKPAPIGPYDYGEYSASFNGGSVYFDGASDYLSTTVSTIGTGAFTFECWANFETLASNEILFSMGAYSPELYYRSATSELAIYHNSVFYTTGFTPETNRWYHIAMVRESNGNTKVYVNGEQKGTTQTYTTNITSTTCYIGHDTTNAYYEGWISDARLVIGTAVYTGSFTPPSGPLTTTGGTYPSTTNVNTSITSGHTNLLLKGTDAHVLDKSQGNNLKLVGAAAVTNATNNSNISSTNAVYFDGTNDYLTLQEPIDIAGDFTFEVWIKPATAWSGAIGSIGGATNGGAGSVMRMNGSGQMGVYSNSPSGVGVIFNANQFSPFTSTSNLNGATLTDYAWTHLALSRSGSTTYLFVNGYRNAITGTGAFNLYFDMVGAQSGPASLFSGYIQDLRVSSKARYTAADETGNIPSAPLKG